MFNKEKGIVQRIAEGARKIAESAKIKHPIRNDPLRDFHADEPGNIRKIIERLIGREVPVDPNVARKFATDATVGTSDTRKKALQSLKDNKFAVLTAENEEQRNAVVDQAKAILKNGKNVPVWVPKDITTPVGVEYAMRLAKLPKAQQDDPYVLYHLTAQLYAQAPWAKMTDEEVRNTRALLNESFAQVKRLALKPNSQFAYKDGDDIEGPLSKNIDIYRSHRLKPLIENPTTDVEKNINIRRKSLEQILEREVEGVYGTADLSEREEANKLGNDYIKLMKRSIDENDPNQPLRVREDKQGNLIEPYFNRGDFEEYKKIIENRLKFLDRNSEHWSPVTALPREAAPSTEIKEKPFADFFKDLDIKVFRPQDQEWIRQIEEVAKTRPDVDLGFMQACLNNLEAKTRYLNLTPEEDLKIRDFLSVARNKLMAKRYERAYSSIALNPDEIQKILKDPLSFLERYVSNIETLILEDGSDSPAIEAMFNRYKLITDFFASETFDSYALADLKTKLTPEAIALMQQKRAFAYKLFQEKSGVLEEYGSRILHVQALYNANFVRDFEKDGQRFLGVIDQISDARFYGMRGLHNGLVDVFSRDYFFPVAREMLGKEEFASIDMMKKIQAEAKLRFTENKHQYQPGYQKFVENKYTILNNMLGLEDPTDEDWILDEARIDSICRLSFASDRLLLKTRGLQNFGVSSWEGMLRGKQDNFVVTMGVEWRMNKGGRHLDWKECWGADDHEREMIMQGSRAILDVDSEVHRYAYGAAEEMWNELKGFEFKEFGGDLTPGSPEETAKKLQDRFLLKLYMAYAQHSPMRDLGGSPTAEKTIEFFKKIRTKGLGIIGKREFIDQVAIHYANPWQEECGGPGLYDVAKSGVRQKAAMLEVLESVLKLHGIKPDTLVQNGYGQGLNLYGVATRWFFPMEDRRSGHEKKAYMKVLTEISMFHPHELMMLEAEHENLSGGVFDAAEFKKHNKAFHLTQSLLMGERVAPINYLNGEGGLSVDQRRILERSFTNGSGVFDEAGMHAYMKKMGEYAVRYKGESGVGVERFTAMKYANRMREILFYDDVPMDFMDEKDLHTVFERGTQNLIPRAWQDNAKHAMAVVNMILQSLNLKDSKDGKEMIKLGRAIQQGIQGYQTSGRSYAALSMVAARDVGSRSGEFSIGTNLKEGSLFRSRLQKRGSMHDNQDNVEEISELIEAYNALNNIGNVSPHFKEMIEVRGGITRWRKNLLGNDGPLARILGHQRFDQVVEILDANLPFQETALKIARIVGFASLIPLVYLAKEATEAGKGDKSSGSHQ